jgi:hypothetical protein
LRLPFGEGDGLELVLHLNPQTPVATTIGPVQNPLFSHADQADSLAKRTGGLGLCRAHGDNIVLQPRLFAPRKRRRPARPEPERPSPWTACR